MSVTVTNTTASLSGKTLLKAEDSQTITGTKTFDLGGGPPFGVVAGASKVSNLDADLLDGEEASALHNGEQLTASLALQGYSTASLTSHQSAAGAARLAYDSTTKDIKESVNASTFFRRGWVNVKQFGVTGDGTTDDSTAFQAAITAVSASLAGTLYVPNGNYKLVTGLIISKAITIIGESMLSTTLRGHGMTSANRVIDVDGTISPALTGVHLHNMTVMSNDSGRPDLIRLKTVAESSFHDIGFRDGTKGFNITGTVYSLAFERVICINQLAGAAVEFTGAAGGQHAFYSCTFNGLFGVWMGGTALTVDSINFIDCNWEACARAGQFEGTSCIIRNIVFTGGRCEKNVLPFRFQPGAGGVILGTVVTGMFFETDAEAIAIDFEGPGSIFGFVIAGCYVQDYSSSFIQFNNGSGGSVIGNVLNNTPALVNALRPGVVATGNITSAGVASGAQFTPPLVTQTYAVTNPVVRRSYDTTTVTLPQLAQSLGTLIDDLRTAGLVV